LIRNEAAPIGRASVFASARCLTRGAQKAGTNAMPKKPLDTCMAANGALRVDDLHGTAGYVDE